jgi:polyphosphate kinase
MQWVASPVGEPCPDGTRYLDRELSWLDFNARVLAIAEDPDVPLLERMRFLAIFSSNLDEFFQVRVAAMHERLLTSPSEDARAQLRGVRQRVSELVDRQARVFTKEVAPALDEIGLRIVDWDELDDRARSQLDDDFATRIFPVLTPLAVDPAHPFPYISNLSLNLAVIVRDPASFGERFARVKVPPLLPRFLPVPGSRVSVPIEQVIAAHLDTLFPGMTIVARHAFRITRDVDIELSDESEDLLQAIETVLQRRTRFGRVVRLEVQAGAPADLVALLTRELEIDPDDVFSIDGPLDLTGLNALEIDRPDLEYPRFKRQVPLEFTGGIQGIFRAIADHDILVHHPYDSFEGTVEAFVDAAARDPDVVAIKQTLYRTGGDEEGIVASLADASLAGKQVVALVELKARFDEQTNIERANFLEEAGVHVVYGLVGLKTHCKILLVVRREHSGMRRYVHVGTGNYNPKTARIYEDLGLFSVDPELGADVAELFNYLTGYSRPRHYHRLLVAPDSLRPGVLDRVHGQARPDGRIIMKMNSLVDEDLIDALYGASRAGADIDLVVRGICCLRPGVPGLSENIRVRSLLGRYLEHSRIYRFGPDHQAEYFIGSADLMPRNLDRRVEALVSVTGASLQARLDEILAINLDDDRLAWELRSDGTWRKCEGNTVDTHEALQDRAIARTQRGLGES